MLGCRCGVYSAERKSAGPLSERRAPEPTIPFTCSPMGSPACRESEIWFELEGGVPGASVLWHRF